MLSLVARSVTGRLHAAALARRFADHVVRLLRGCVVRDPKGERKEAEDAFHDSEGRVRHAFEDSAIGMAVQHLTGAILRVNPALRRIWNALGAAGP